MRCAALVLIALAGDGWANGVERGPSVALVPRTLAPVVDPFPERDPEKLGRWLPLPEGWSPQADSMPMERPLPAGAYDAGGGVVVLPRIEHTPGGACEAFAGATVTLPGGRTLVAATAGAPAPRFLQAVASTGRYLVVFGGMGADTRVLGGGAVLDLKKNRWRPLPVAGMPSRRYRPFVAVANDRVFIWGGEDDNGEGRQTRLNDGAVFDPAKHRWTAVTAEGAPAPRVNVGHTACVRGTRGFVLVSGGEGERDEAVHVYDQRRGRWSSLQPPANSQWWTHSWAMKDGRVLLVAAWLQHVVIVDPAAATLLPIPVPEELRSRAESTVTWTGSRLIVRGGWRNDPNWIEPDSHHGDQYGFPTPPPRISYSDGWSYAPR